MDRCAAGCPTYTYISFIHTHGAGKGQDEVLNREIEQMTMDYLEKQLTTVLKKARQCLRCACLCPV